MQALYSIDTAVFRWINQSIAHPFLDWLMPLASNPHSLLWLVFLLAGAVIWKGGTRGRLCIVMLVCVVVLGEGLVWHPLKLLFERARPFNALPDVRLLVGKGNSYSMPSSHAANVFAAATVLFVYYRRSGWIMLPLALLVGISRIYNGVHYPSDVVAGSAVGLAFAASFLWGAETLWTGRAREWFPLWTRRMPSLLHPDACPMPSENDLPAGEAPEAQMRQSDAQWRILGWALILGLLVFRWWYISANKIELSEDEAYQWVWSKHLDLSYYSKPPMIAYLQFLGTRIWGDTEFGVRFLSPLITALISGVLFSFFCREVSARAGFWLIMTLSSTVLLGVGSVLLTIDPPSAMFWTLAMVYGWRAMQPAGRTVDWMWTGLWMGLGFLSKYTALAQLASFALAFLLWRPSRIHLRKPGPYLALVLIALSTLPVLIWNAQHGWITVTHLSERAGLAEGWRPTLRYFIEFTGAELGLLNPIFFVAAVAACWRFWEYRKDSPLMVHFFCMGAPLLFGYWLYSLRARVLPNWIAPSVVPLFCLLVVYADRKYREGMESVRSWLVAGLCVGIPIVILAHDTNLTAKLTGRYLPAKVDPLRRVRAWKETARVVAAERARLLEEGKPVFIIGDHYGITGQLSFYLPEAKAGIQTSPLVYYRTSDRPQNQFYFWEGYQKRKGQNAIYVQQGKPGQPPAMEVVQEFERVEDWGCLDVTYRGRVFRRVQIFACRGLR